MERGNILWPFDILQWIVRCIALWTKQKQIGNRLFLSKPTSRAITSLKRPTPSTGGFTGASRTPLRPWTPSWFHSGLPVETLLPRPCTELVTSRHGKLLGFLCVNWTIRKKFYVSNFSLIRRSLLPENLFFMYTLQQRKFDICSYSLEFWRILY